MNEEIKQEIKLYIKELEWQVNYHEDKLRKYRLMLDLHQDILNDAKKK